MRGGRGWMAAVVAAATVATGGAATAAAHADGAHGPAGPTSFANGELTNTQGLAFNPFGPPTLQFVTAQLVGFEQGPGETPPRVGEVFYIHGLVGVVGTSSEAPIMEFIFDEKLAPDIEFAISAEHPVRCFFVADLGKPNEKQDASDTCSQSPTAGSQGTFFGSRPLSPGESFEVQVPVVVSKVKNGIGTGDGARFGLHVKPANADPALAEQHLFVAEAPPGADGAPGAAGTTTKAGAVGLKVLRQGRTARRVLRLRVLRRSRVSGVIQRRRVVRTKNEHARKVTWKKVRSVRARTLNAGTRRVALGRLSSGRYRVVLKVRQLGGGKSTVRKTFRVVNRRK